jgi:hypothetical protein
MPESPLTLKKRRRGQDDLRNDREKGELPLVVKPAPRLASPGSREAKRGRFAYERTTLVLGDELVVHSRRPFDLRQ